MRNETSRIAYQRGKYELQRCSSGVIATTQNQTLSLDFDIAVRLYPGVQLVYHPDLPGGIERPGQYSGSR